MSGDDAASLLQETRWQFPDPAGASTPDLVGLGADLAPATLLEAYARGIFPMPLDRRGPIAWWSPDPRAVLELEDFQESRSLRKSARRYRVTWNEAFAEVVRACADPRRANGWIDPRIEDAYVQLHRLGFAHSVETWDDHGNLVGGLYGVAVAGLFAGESMFHRSRDASKVALRALVQTMRVDEEPRLLDVQFLTPHLERLGAREIPRRSYLRRLSRALEIEPLPVARAGSQ